MDCKVPPMPITVPPSIRKLLLLSQSMPLSGTNVPTPMTSPIFCNTIADIVSKHVAGVSPGIRVILILAALTRLTDSLAPEGGDSLRDVLLYVQEIEIQFLNMVIPFRKQLSDARNIVGIVVQSVHD